MVKYHQEKMWELFGYLVPGSVIDAGGLIVCDGGIHMFLVCLDLRKSLLCLIFRWKTHGFYKQTDSQGHAAPGAYARAYLEGRLDLNHIMHFRQEAVHGSSSGGGKRSKVAAWVWNLR